MAKEVFADMVQEAFIMAQQGIPNMIQEDTPNLTQEDTPTTTEQSSAINPTTPLNISPEPLPSQFRITVHDIFRDNPH